MKDCSSCKKKPDAGSVYEDTACCHCTPFEPSNNRMGVMEQKPSWWWTRRSKHVSGGWPSSWLKG